MSILFRKAASASSNSLLRSFLAAPTTSGATAAAAAITRPMSVSAMIQAGRDGGFNSYGSSQQSSPPSKTLFVGGLSWDTTSDELREAFEKTYGESVINSKLIWDRMNDRSKGFGYVEFIDEATAMEAKDNMSDSLLGGRRIRLDFANADPATSNRSSSNRERPAGAPSATLYFGNLPNAMSTSELTEILSEELGSENAPIDVRFPVGRDGPQGDAQNKGFGYVQFDSTEQATNALSVLKAKVEADEFSLDGRAPRIDFETPRKEFSADGGRGGRGGFGGSRGGRGGGYGGSRDTARFDRARSDRNGRSDRFGSRRGGSDYDL